jgi:hypothetical protein
MRSIVVTTLLLSLAAGAYGAIVLQDNFDGYADQAAFEAAWPAVTAGSPAVLSTTQAHSGTQSAYIQTGTTRNAVRMFAETVASDANPLEVSYWMYDPMGLAAAGRSYIQLKDYSPTSGTQLLAMGSYNSGGSYYYARVAFMPGGTGAANWFMLNAAGAPQRSVGWHEMKMVIKGTTIDFLVDGILSGSKPYCATAGLVSFEEMRLGSGISSTIDYYCDDVKIEVTPEPASLVLVALGGLALLRRR